MLFALVSLSALDLSKSITPPGNTHNDWWLALPNLKYGAKRHWEKAFEIIKIPHLESAFWVFLSRGEEINDCVLYSVWS
jgi:hypothetical protein